MKYVLLCPLELCSCIKGGLKSRLRRDAAHLHEGRGIPISQPDKIEEELLVIRLNLIQPALIKFYRRSHPARTLFARVPDQYKPLGDHFKISGMALLFF
jgi:hypothetical protein